VQRPAIVSTECTREHLKIKLRRRDLVEDLTLPDPESTATQRIGDPHTPTTSNMSDPQGYSRTGARLRSSTSMSGHGRPLIDTRPPAEFGADPG
jgi:hypothetical protein